MSPIHVEGWAYDLSAPNGNLVMAVVVDGTFAKWVSCDRHRPDVAATASVPERVGFYVDIPHQFQDGKDHIVEFRCADGTPIGLEGPQGVAHSWHLINGAPPRGIAAQPLSIIGHLDEIQGDKVHGWAYDPMASGSPVRLEIAVDGDIAGSIACDIERPDVAAAGFPVSRVGFAFTLPVRYFDGQPHVLEIRCPKGRSLAFSANDEEDGTRRTFSLPAESVVANIEGLCDGAVRGWVFLDDHKNGRKRGSLQLLVKWQGHPIAQLTAREFRPDVAAAHGCDPNCGFAFFPPAEIVAGRAVELEFAVLPGHHRLPGCPVRIEFPSLETVAALRDLRDSAEQLFTEMWLLRDRIRRLMPDETYTVENCDVWARRYQTSLTNAPDQLAGLLPLAEDSARPLVSIVCPVHKPRLADFAGAVESVRAQSYPNWELIIVDDASKSPRLTEYMQDLARQDRRIKVVKLRSNRGISGATNAALEKATGRYVGFLDHDDLLADRAVEFMLAAALRSGAQLLYSDEDKIDDDGTFSEVHLKPDWNYRLLLSENYVCHFLFVERAQLSKVGAFHKECDGAQDHDIVLRLCEVIPDHKILHVPEILYHWRKTPASTANSAEAKTYAAVAGCRAVQSHLERKGLEGRVRSLRGTTCYEIEWVLARRAQPAVTIIIPYREQIAMTRACLESLWGQTDYNNYTILLVDNWSTSDEAFAFAAEMKDRPGVSLIRVEEPYNFARLNNLAVAASDSEFLLFMNNDIVILDVTWLQAMMGEMLADPRVGIVGSKLVYPNRRVQHGGVVLGVGGVADHAHKGLAADDPGYCARAICAQEMSAVTAACMLCRRSVFDAVGGFDERDLKVAFNDVDLCLKAGVSGYRIVWTPSAVLEHHESLSRGSDLAPERQARFFHEHETMMRRWGAVIPADRYYHRLFSRKSGMFSQLADPSSASISELMSMQGRNDGPATIPRKREPKKGSAGSSLKVAAIGQSERRPPLMVPK